ncbi:hypothetical protein PENSPDRAFT_595723, partial [Peniophora sp. CONT]
MHDVVAAQQEWRRAQKFVSDHIQPQTPPSYLMHVIPGVAQLFDILGWDVRLHGPTNLGSRDLSQLFSRRTLSGTFLDSALSMSNGWRKVCAAFLGEDIMISTLDLQWPFLLAARDPSVIDWGNLFSERAGSLSYLRDIGEELLNGSLMEIAMPLWINENHYAAVSLNPHQRTLYYGDSLIDSTLPQSDLEGLRSYARALGYELQPTVQPLAHSIQADGHSCPDCTINTIERRVWPLTRPWTPTLAVLERAEYALLLATHQTVYSL